MTPERLRQIRDVFEAALENPSELRSAFLDDACGADGELRGEVQKLLDAHEESGGVLDQPLLVELKVPKMEGRRIGPYEIVREIGHGGMGTVYLAVRADDVFRKEVAIKLIRPGAASEEVIRRFRLERQILAALDHPNIARIIDGGSTEEGLPYFVMDYVEGEPIDDWCDHHNLNVRERLRLFGSVCAAVEYAHSKGFVHRDLKPSNILVTAEGAIKLLDFGIAKLLPAEFEETLTLTQPGMWLMTPEYASPEQVKGENVSLATDVYSLGVVLYELLTGSRPYRMRSRLFHEIVRVICEEEPTRPSTAASRSHEGKSKAKTCEGTVDQLRRRLSGDLDNILLKTLRKEPAQRYVSVAQFREDLKRHLEGLPILARRGSPLHRAYKFLWRHRAWAAALGLVLLSQWMDLFTIRGNIVILMGVLGFAATWSLYFTASRLDDSKRAKRIFIGAGLVFLLFAMASAWFLTAPPSNRPVGQVAHPWLKVWLPNLLIWWSVLAGVQLLAWPIRHRWAGSLLLDLGWPTRPSSIFTAICSGLGGTIMLFVPSYPGKAALILSCGMTAVCAMVLGRVEIRKRGFVISGTLLRWHRIGEFSWGPVGERYTTLRLRSKSRFPFLALPVAVPILPIGTRAYVPIEKKKEVESIIRQYLSEWVLPR